MANINISFNDKFYNIDESFVSKASADLRAHLSTIMNGTGATINFGGTPYNIDSVKLTDATNDFVSHISTISGSGMKVIVNGVEYNIDSSKMSDVIDCFSNILGSLSNSDDVTDEIINYQSEPVAFDENSTSLVIAKCNNVGHLVDRAPYFRDSDCYVVIVNGTEFIINTTYFMRDESGRLKPGSLVVGRYNDTTPILCTLKLDRRTGLGVFTIEFTAAPTEPVSAYLIYKTVNDVL